MALNLVQLYVNVLTKALVSAGGSPTTVPPLFYGDTCTFAIYPVVPASALGNPLGTNGQQFNSFSLAGYTMNLTMAGTPNATAPPTPFASFDGMVWNAGLGAFIGAVDMTVVAVGTFIGTAAAATAYINFDVFDAALKRTTLYQGTFSLQASIDAVAAGPGAGAVQYITLAQALALFVQIGAIPGKHIDFQSPDTTKKATLYLGDDGVEHWDILP